MKSKQFKKFFIYVNRIEELYDLVVSYGDALGYQSVGCKIKWEVTVIFFDIDGTMTPVTYPVDEGTQTIDTFERMSLDEFFIQTPETIMTEKPFEMSIPSEGFTSNEKTFMMLQQLAEYYNAGNFKDYIIDTRLIEDSRKGGYEWYYYSHTGSPYALFDKDGAKLAVKWLKDNPGEWVSWQANWDTDGK